MNVAPSARWRVVFRGQRNVVLSVLFYSRPRSGSKRGPAAVRGIRRDTGTRRKDGPGGGADAARAREFFGWPRSPGCCPEENNFFSFTYIRTRVFVFLLGQHAVENPFFEKKKKKKLSDTKKPLEIRIRSEEKYVDYLKFTRCNLSRKKK